jgi:hypothetical protein
MTAGDAGLVLVVTAAATLVLVLTSRIVAERLYRRMRRRERGR